MKDHTVHMFFSQEDDGYIAQIPELPGCSAFGTTQQDALAELQQARDAWLASARDQGTPIPRPKALSPAR